LNVACIFKFYRQL